ncbi:MAG TPA: TonB-dependent receptor [Clostridia bacterium]|nr:TonB-dependent receptor [Clostridia bacterium]
MRNTIYLGLVLALLVCNLVAQQNTAQLNGTVQDASGAVIPGATVSVSSADTGFLRTTQTNERGAYTLPFLRPGTYSLKVEAKGFSTVLRPKVELAVGRFATVNVTVQPGSETQVLNVTGEAPLVDTSRSEIAGNVSPLEVRELPISDRNFSGLMSLVPGVRPAEGFDPTKTRSGNVSVNGSDGRSIDYNVDGGDNKDNVIGGIVQNFTMEGIQEFGVVVNRYSAEAGRASSAVVNVVSKSGTNAVHGTAFGQFQNSALNKNNFFRLQNCKDLSIAEDNCPKPLFHRYHFGGSIGGPIVKDKFFFFGAYEQKREPGKIPVDNDAFSELSLFPLAEPVRQVPFPYIDHLLTVKLDYHISNQQTAYIRYGREKWTNPNDQLGNPIVTDISQANSDTNQFHDLAIGHNFTFATNKVNSLTLHFQDFVNAILAAPGRTFTYPIAGGGEATNPEICFIPDQGCGSGTAPEIGQNVNVPQQTLIRKYQVRDDFSWTVGRHNQKFGVNWIYLAKLGGFFFFGANGYQITFFDKPSDILGNTAKYPQGFATPGAVQSILFSGGSGSTAQPPAHSIALYYQDDIKVTPKLTLNLGIRWDANPRFLVPQLGNSLTNTNRAIDILRTVVAANPSSAAAQDGLARARFLAGDDELLRKRQTSWKEFQPRIGFAYNPTGSGKIVIRGGYGISRDQVFQNLTLFAIQQTQPTIYQTVIDLEASHAPPSCAGDPFVCSFRFGIDPLPAPAPGVTDLAVGATGRILEPRITDPWSQQASIGTAIQFGEDLAASVDYYHVLGTHEPRVLQMNPIIRPICDPAFPGSNPSDARCVAGADTRLLDAAFVAAGLGANRISELRAYGTNNRSIFDSVNFQLQKRMSHNFTFQASYVLSWSRSWGGRPTSSYSGSGIVITPEQEFRPEEFGPTIFDERHRFVVSGVLQLPAGFVIAPIFQASSARPYSFNASTDIDGDGRSTIDRVCEGSTPQNPITTTGCTQVKPNSLRGDPYVNLDLRTSKAFKFTERAQLTVFWEFFNLFNRDNFCNDFSGSASEVALRQPQGYCGGQGFGPAFGSQFKSQYGFRFAF